MHKLTKNGVPWITRSDVSIAFFESSVSKSTGIFNFRHSYCYSSWFYPDWAI